MTLTLCINEAEALALPADLLGQPGLLPGTEVVAEARSEGLFLRPAPRPIWQAD